MQPAINTQDFTLSLPSDWLDKSLYIWSAPPQPDDTFTPNIVTTREALLKPLERLIDDKMQELLNASEELEIIHRQDTTVEGRKAIDLLYSWNNNGTHLKQRQVFIPLKDDVLTFAFSAAFDDYDQHLPMFEQIQTGIKWT